MLKVIGVRFKSVGKIYYFSCGDTRVLPGEGVIVETARGTEFGEVVMPEKEIDEQAFAIPVKPIVRRATEQDYKQLEENKEKVQEARRICLEKIKENELEMNLIDVEYTFDRSKILFYFTADGRVDFRQLVKDLASVFRTRIELRQIGVRDEAKMLGGLGICGRQLCCSLFLGDFEPVSIKMAKEQSLSLNPTKISGTCGRLMCCLKYEQEAYEDLLSKTPNPGAVVDTPAGRGIVASTNLLKGLVQVKMDSQNEKVLSEFKVDEVVIIKDGRDKRMDDEADIALLKELEKD
ncbi:MAG: stage 0 sporulation family protein [Clostridia bacterium]|nr:stage 0 sporulation family protein [Clostridia bacterium]MBQ3553608.1 stage 0 sporulation family protein [Clostridia bacterium]